MSAIDERSPKRQRLDSYSPASPPPHHTKTFVPPHTPPPSEWMSPSWQMQTVPHQQPGSRDGAFPTPPSTAGCQSRMTGRGSGSEAGGDSGRQTPASVDDGDIRREGDGDAEMADRHGDEQSDISMLDAEHRRTDHERQEDGGDMATLTKLYKISTEPVAPSKPHSSQNFIELYSLQKIQASVARRDPNTGEKINKLRKSYENKVKALGLEGRNKAQPNLHELEGLLDPAWSIVDPNSGLSLWEGEDRNRDNPLGNLRHQQDMFSKLNNAFGMLPGRLPVKEHNEWKNMLGLDDLVAAATGARTPASGAIKPAAASAISRTAPAARSSAPASPRNAIRPDRSGKKRRYDDGSFEGYGDGFDDDGDSAGGSDGSRRSSNPHKRQKRKDFSSTQNSPAFPNAQNNGLVGVRSS